MTRQPIDPILVPDHLVVRYQPAELLALLGTLAMREVDRVAMRRNRRGLQVHPARATATAYDAAKRALTAIGAPNHLATALAVWLIDEGRQHEHGTHGRLTR
ncbi:MAG: hypothetical protein OXE45_09370 [bacterium]|nr:hypothetical protein [bacterium]